MEKDPWFQEYDYTAPSLDEKGNNQVPSVASLTQGDSLSEFDDDQDSSFESMLQDDMFLRQQRAILLQYEEDAKLAQSLSEGALTPPDSPQECESPKVSCHGDLPSISSFSDGSTTPNTQDSTQPVCFISSPGAEQDLGYNSSASSLQSSESFLQYLNDPVAIEEQQEILKSINSQKKKCPPTSARRSQPRHFYTNPTARDMEDLTVHMEEAVLRRSTSGASRHGTYMEETVLRRTPSESSHATAPTSNLTIPMPPPLSRLDPTPTKIVTKQPPTKGDTPGRSSREHPPTSITTTSYAEDGVVELYGQKKIRIKGTRNTWKNIATGNATLVQCPACFSILQVGSSAKLLYCTKCKEISPIGGGLTETKSLPGGCDYDIAKTVQEQEMNVAYARKMAKSAH